MNAMPERAGVRFDVRPSKGPRLLSHGYVNGLPKFIHALGGLQWSNGYKTPPLLPTPSSPIFKGATAFQPWIHYWHDDAFALHNHLQRSHGFSAMDTCATRPACSALPALQRSHGLSAMDTPARVATVMETAFLQWSHGLSAMDTRPKRKARYSKPLTFNGAMAFQPWIRKCRAANPS